MDFDVARILERRNQLANVLPIIRIGIVLLEQQLLCASVPGACPVFVGPEQAKRKLWLAGCQHLCERTLQDSSSIEPIVVVAKAMDAVLSGKRRLSFTYLGDPKIVKTEICRQVRLVMAREQWPRAYDIGPFGKARSPPGVVLRHRMVLGQVEGNRAHGHGYTLANCFARTQLVGHLRSREIISTSGLDT